MRYAQVVPILALVPPVDGQASDASLLGLIALASQVMADLLKVKVTNNVAILFSCRKI